MPGYSQDGLKKVAFFTTISLLLLPVFAVRGAQDFEASLKEGKEYGEEILSRHSDILRPSEVGSEAVPGYEIETQKELRSTGSRWMKNPDSMRTNAEETIKGGEGVTSDAPGSLKRSSAQRPVFTIDSETDPMSKTSTEAIKNPVTQCQKKETCEEYTESSWNEREVCYDQATLNKNSCNVRKTITVKEKTQTWNYMTLEIDRNDAGAGFSASIDTDGSRDVNLISPGCFNRQKESTWGNFGGFTLGGPYWKGCFTLERSGSFATAPDSTCTSVFGTRAGKGKLPLGDGAGENASLENVIAFAIRSKFPPPPDTQISGTIESRWGKARRCREGDGDGNGWRASYAATRTTYETDIKTENGCVDNERNRNCLLTQSRCLKTEETPDGDTVCTNMERSYVCSGPLSEDGDCAQLRSDGCHQIGGRCIMHLNEHPELPDPGEANLGPCLVHENIYECPKNAKLCRRKNIAFECDGKIRCASGDDCFDTSVEQNVDYPRVASHMAMLEDMEKCLATTRDGESSEEGYEPIEIDGAPKTTSPPIDCADVSGEEVTIFKGKRYRCDLNLAGFIQNCCRKKGFFSGACPASTKELRARRDDARACHYVGIHKKKVLGITLKKRKVYCCLNSKMARVIHEQARGQLMEKGLWNITENGGWGRAKNPFCGGMSTEQFQKIDFDAVDFSEIHADLTDGADMPDITDSTKKTEKSVENLCPENLATLNCKEKKR